MARYAIFYELMSGKIMSYTSLPIIMPIPNTNPTQYFDVADRMIALPGMGKVVEDFAVVPRDELYYVDSTDGTPNITPKKKFDTGNALTGTSLLGAIVPLRDIPNDTWWYADGISSISYGPNLPVGTLVTVECANPAFGPAQMFTIDDGDFTFTTTIPGIYTLTVEVFPYIDKIITATAKKTLLQGVLGG